MSRCWKKLNKISVVTSAAIFASGFFGAVAFAQINPGAQTPPLINITKIPHPLALPPGVGSVTYDYTVINEGTIPMRNISVIDNGCSAVSFTSGDTNSNSVLDTSEIWKYRCITNVSQTTTSAVVVTGEADGFIATDTSSATVFVGVPLPPPLIHLVKTPSAFVLPAGGGSVTYTYAVTNPGPAALSNVSITDDKCTGLPGRVEGHPGDLNKNDLLESNETWTFTCLTNINQTTTNTGTVQGTANGLTATDSSSVIVVVSSVGFPTTGSVPGLPNTGFPSAQKGIPWIFIAPTALLVALLSFYLARKKLII